MEGVDAAVDPEETPGPGSVLDAVWAETRAPQLLPANQVLLIGREPCDGLVTLRPIGRL